MPVPTTYTEAHATGPIGVIPMSTAMSQAPYHNSWYAPPVLPRSSSVGGPPEAYSYQHLEHGQLYQPLRRGFSYHTEGMHHYTPQVATSAVGVSHHMSQPTTPAFSNQVSPFRIVPTQYSDPWNVPQNDQVPSSASHASASPWAVASPQFHMKEQDYQHPP